MSAVGLGSTVNAQSSGNGSSEVGEAYKRQRRKSQWYSDEPPITNADRKANTDARSVEFALVGRILGVWCDYMERLGWYVGSESNIDDSVEGAEALRAVILELEALSSRLDVHYQPFCTEVGGEQLQSDVTSVRAKLEELAGHFAVLLGEQKVYDTSSIDQIFPSIQSAAAENESSGSMQCYVETQLRASHSLLLPVLRPWNVVHVPESVIWHACARTLTIIRRLLANLKNVLLQCTGGRNEVCETAGFCSQFGKLDRTLFDVLSGVKTKLFEMNLGAATAHIQELFERVQTLLDDESWGVKGGGSSEVVDALADLLQKV